MAETVGRPKSRSDITKDVAKRLSRNENSVLIFVLVALIGGFSVITKGLSSAPANIVNLLIQSSIRGVAAVGQAFVILTAGIDLSVGGIGLVSAVLGASLITRGFMNILGEPIPLAAALSLMLLVGIGWGAVNGVSVSRIGMPPLIVTLAMWEITKGVGFAISGGRTIGELPELMEFFGPGTIAGIPVPVIIWIAVMATGYFVLYHTTFGRSVYAVGGNRVSAWLSGIKVRRIQLMVYIISGFLSALAGVIITGRVMSASMRTLSGLELDTIGAVCVGGVSLMGGKGTLIGVLLGVLIIGVINNGLSILGAGPAQQGITKGAIIFTAVAIDFLRRRRERSQLI